LLCAPEGAVDAVLLGFQLLLWELVYLKTVERTVHCFKKGDRTRQHFFVRKNGYSDIYGWSSIIFLSDIVKVFPNVKYKKNNESKE
jgi:hypothetical protein